MSSIELRGLEVSQGFWDVMCSLNLIYVKVKAIVLTKERNTINMQSAAAGKAAVSVAGSLWEGSDSGWQWDEEALRCSLGNASRRKMRGFYLLYLYFSFSPSLKQREAAALRHAETIWGESAQGGHIDCMGPAQPQRWCSVPPTALSQPGRFACRNLTLGLSAISIPPAQSSAKSCRLQQSLLWVWVYLS